MIQFNLKKSMIIKKFEEYKFPMEHNDIADEYAKIILSKFIDEDLDDISMQKIYNDIIKEEELEEDQEKSILDSLYRYSTELAKKASKVKTLISSEASKYNL